MGRGNRLGAIYMVLSMVAITVNDTLIKFAGESLPLFQLIFVRGALVSVAFLILALWLRQFRLPASRRDRILLFLRSAAEFAGTYFFLTALFNMPIANITAVLQALPLAVTMASALFLGESVGWRRWSAICIGFIGVLLIVRPGTDGFTIYSVYGLAAVLCITLRDIVARQISAEVSGVFASFFAASAVMTLGAIGSIGQGWAPIDPLSAVMILGAAAFLMAAYYFSYVTMHHGDIAFVSPFRYTNLVAAMFFGLLVFGEWPDALTLIGAAIVVGTGIYTFYRENQVAHGG